MEILAENLEGLARAAKILLSELSPGRQASVVALSGELGAGKTAFVKAAAAALGVAEIVTSPTFVLEKVYKLPRGPFARLVHVDAYRLEKPEELRALGWRDLAADPGNIVFVEWAERVEPLLPEGARRVRIELLERGARRISW